MNYCLDCRRYRGDKPCGHVGVCAECADHAPMGTRILIIKLGAMGDVLRTTPILEPLRRKYDPCHVTWLTFEESHSLLQHNPLIDRIYTYGLDAVTQLRVERFDMLICLDKISEATTLASLVAAEDKLGFGMDEHGSVYALNSESEYALSLGLDDELKFRLNDKTYQQVTSEAIRLPYNHEEYVFQLTDEEVQWGRDFLKKRGLKKDGPIVGINTGCGTVFATKKWTEDGFVELSQSLRRELEAPVALLGGPDEVECNQSIMKRSSASLIDTGCDNTLRQFASILNGCDVVVSADTIAMHLAIALRKQVVALFGPTCPQEIDLYGRGTKIAADKDCTPYYKQACARKPSCMETITAEEVFDVVRALISSGEAKA